MSRFTLMPLSVCLIGLTMTAAQADDWATRPDDQLLTADDLADRLRGQTLTYYDDATSRFGDDGRYAYTYGEGGTWLGDYEIRNDSTACVTFVTGTTRCDLYVINNDRLIVITDSGDRFPIRSITPN